MVFRIFVEKRPGFDVEAQQTCHELRDILGIAGLERVRMFNRYDVEGIDAQLFDTCVSSVLSEPQADRATRELPDLGDAAVFAVEYLPGQFDQRAESAGECVQLISRGLRPQVRTAWVYALVGELSKQDVAAVKRFLINPVEAREASFEPRATLALDAPEPAPVEVIEGFTALDQQGLERFIKERGLAMDIADLEFFQSYFAQEGREPTITEVRVVDTYWSDHCRHTTFGTELDEVRIDDKTVQEAFNRYLQIRRELGRDERPVCLMDMGTIGARSLRARGLLSDVDESEEVNACTVRVSVDVDGRDEDWLFLFKNETHNHPTEIEPFGGAATCVGGAIRDPLSGRGYVYQAMRVSGAADPRVPVSQTLAGKLPQRRIVTEAAAGYSSYGNQIGLATGQVSELYHPGYAAKRMEVGAVLGAVPADQVRREVPTCGDVVVLLGGRTGRDGIGGATGSSKAHNLESVEECGAEVQKGNAPVERKLQRLFRRKEACCLIKRCNDFGAGGVSVAIGELCDGVEVDLDAIPKKYEGLDGTELAIAESQERMAVVLSSADVERFLALAREENVEATVVARVTDQARVRMHWRGCVIVDLSREFLASNGAPKHQVAHVEAPRVYKQGWQECAGHGGLATGSCGRVPEEDGGAAASGQGGGLAARLLALVSDLNICSQKGLGERFDSTIGAATVLMPFGGARQLTPAQAMVAKLPVMGKTRTVSGMAWGFNPSIMDADPFRGAYLSVVESVAKLVAAGFARKRAYLSFQEYFEKLRDEPRRWGKPVAALLGALEAQLDLSVGAIGGKDSMSGSFEDLDVPPTLISFAVATGDVGGVVSPEFKEAGHRIVLVVPRGSGDGLRPDAVALVCALDTVEALIAAGGVRAAYACGHGGAAEALFKMCVGNRLGCDVAAGVPDPNLLFGVGEVADQVCADAEAASGDESCASGQSEAGQLVGAPFLAADSDFVPGYGSFVLEVDDAVELPSGGKDLLIAVVGHTTQEYVFAAGQERVDLAELQEAWERALEGVFPYRDPAATEFPPIEALTWTERTPRARDKEAWTTAFEITDVDAACAAAAERSAAGAGTHQQASRVCAGEGQSFDEDGSGSAVASEAGTAPFTSAFGAVGAVGGIGKPRVIIPVFPGTNCEYDSAAAFERAGAQVEVLVINNLTPSAVGESVEALARAIRRSQIVMLPGGFSGGDEPDGSAKFITAFFRAPEVTEAVSDLMHNRDGLMLGICNGFQALVKLGLVPFGEIRLMDETCPTLTFNAIGRHQSGLVRTRVASSLSPWLARCEVGEVHTVAVSHGEGRFVANDGLLAWMKMGGQIATQYVDEQGRPSAGLGVNPNGSVLAIEGITSPDGRILGKMGHSERAGEGLYRNIPGIAHQPLFESGVDYFRL